MKFVSPAACIWVVDDNPGDVQLVLCILTGAAAFEVEVANRLPKR